MADSGDDDEEEYEEEEQDEYEKDGFIVDEEEDEEAEEEPEQSSDEEVKAKKKKRKKRCDNFFDNVDVFSLFPTAIVRKRCCVTALVKSVDCLCGQTIRVQRMSSSLT